MINLTQRFGRDCITPLDADADTITALELDRMGNYMAVGDRGGRVVMFEKTSQSRSGSDSSKPEPESDDWSPYFQFKSHNIEFDYLKSIEIEEKISQIKFLPQNGCNKFILSANDKIVKLWKIGEKRKQITENVTSTTANNIGNPFLRHRLSEETGGLVLISIIFAIYFTSHIFRNYCRSSESFPRCPRL